MQVLKKTTGDHAVNGLLLTREQNHGGKALGGDEKQVLKKTTGDHAVNGLLLTREQNHGGKALGEDLLPLRSSHFL